VKNILGTIVAVTILTAATAGHAGKVPVSFSARGGIGQAYVSMGALNDHFSLLRENLGTDLVSIDNGFQVCLEGRVWLYNRVAAVAGWEHYWIEASIDAGSYGLLFKAPTNTLLLGAAVKVYEVPDLLDVNLSARGLFGSTVYGSNEFTGNSTLEEYKNNSYGWDFFVEATSTFIRPVEVGFMLGYRSLEISELRNKFDEIAEHSISGDPVVLDFSGVYYYITAGFRLW
jgi:hypothetical protein